jgi:Domain of unknown function (DUF4249)
MIFVSKFTILKSYVKFLHVDKNYYLYHESVQRNDNNGNPFAEPSLVFTNISNGYGCFGSFSTIDKDIILPIK